MTSQLIAPENARVCSVSGFLSIRNAKFHFDRFKSAPLRGEKLKKSAR